MPTATMMTTAATLHQERLDVQRFPSYSELSASTQARLRRLAGRNLSVLRLKVSEVDEIQAVLGESTAHLRVPCKSYEHGRMVCFDASLSLAWTV